MNELFEFIKEVNSTNTYIWDLSQKEKLPQGYCVCAQFQSAGRGQIGNIWESKKGENLLCSMLIYSGKIPVTEQFILSKIVSLAICDCLKELNITTKIKYPNDIFYKNKKLAGILIENRLSYSKMQYSIVGIGLNINQLEFEFNNDTAISMRKIVGKTFEIKEVAYLLHRYIVNYFETFQYENKTSIAKRYFDNLFRADGLPYQYQTPDGKRFYATIKDVSNNGILNLCTKEKKIVKFAFKEVQFII